MLLQIRRKRRKIKRTRLKRYSDVIRCCVGLVGCARNAQITCCNELNVRYSMLVYERKGVLCVNAQSDKPQPGTPRPATDKPQGGQPKKRVLEGNVIVEELKEGHGPDAKNGKMVSYRVNEIVVDCFRNNALLDGRQNVRICVC